MIQYKDVLSMSFYEEKQAFSGSDSGLRYRIKMGTPDGDEGPKVLEVWAWPEPLSFENTDDDKKLYKDFPFTEEGLEAAVDWLNEHHDTVADMVVRG